MRVSPEDPSPPGGQGSWGSSMPRGVVTVCLGMLYFLVSRILYPTLGFESTYLCSIFCTSVPEMRDWFVANWIFFWTGTVMDPRDTKELDAS